MKGNWAKIVLAVIALFFVNYVAHRFNFRFDLTEDSRYTLSNEAKNTVQAFESPVIVDVLLQGNLPAEFARLQDETVQLLKSFRSANNKVSYNLVNPLESDEDVQQTLSNLQQIGLTPANVTIQEDGKTSQEFVFPWAMVNYGNKTVKVPLLKNKLGTNAEERINNSVQQLEYVFADAFTKLNIKAKKKVAVLKGNGELEDIYMADFLSTIRDYYNIGAFTLDPVASNPQKTFEELKEFDLALIAKPTEPFTDKEKYVLDQFIVQGGRSIWLIDQVAMELDSLFNEKGTAIATRRDLNLDDLLFRYGVRINPVLVNDLYNTPIVLASGEANESQYNPLPWIYHPMVFSRENHPINTNIEALKFQFSNTIDTLANGYEKSILLQSSPLSKAEGTPKQIRLDILNTAPQKEDYPPANGFPLAVLLEGEFTSAYANRVKPLSLSTTAMADIENKMIVISDGDLIKNQLQNGRPLELGYDKWTSSFYGNKEFLVNCFNYLLEDTGLINIRNKKVAIPLLDIQKIADDKSKWQFITIGIPVLLTVLLGLGLNYLRKRKYSA